MARWRRLRQLKSWWRRTWTMIAPGTAVWQAAGAGMLLVGVIFATISAYDAFSRYAWWSFPGITIVFMAIVALAAGIGVVVVRWLGRLPWFFSWSLTVTVASLMLAFDSGGQDALPFVTPYLLVTGACSGAAVSILYRQTWSRETRIRRIMIGMGALVGFSGLLLLTGWLWWSGESRQTLPNAALAALPISDTLSTNMVQPLADRTKPGPYAVSGLTYGSGQDKHRPEYGAMADLLTTAVNGDPFISGWTELRTHYWGFDETALPRNGRVWYPAGSGPFPLVFILHGNHTMSEFSDSGYAYLAELWASRGFIVVAVDENFLNGSAVADWLGRERLKDENDARAWLLLEHLALWRGWQVDNSNPFYEKVDLERIALIGHSRGGEAVAVASVFNRLDRYPDNGRIRFNYDFGIMAVAAIAPVDGQYEPADSPTTLSDVNYLVLHGSHDMDVTSFTGQRQFARTHFSGGDWFKASVYVYGANHGQFNTVWGNGDRSAPAIGLYNLGQLLPPADQQQTAKLFLTAFLEATLSGKSVYEAVFRDHRLARDWLPETIYLTQFADAATQPLAEFEEDVDVTTATQPGSTVSALNLTTWREASPPLKGRDLDSHAVLLGWRAREGGQTAVYAIDLPAEAAIAPDSILVFDLADDGPYVVAGEETEKPELRSPLDLSIRLTDEVGETAVLPLSAYGFLQPQLASHLLKLSFLSEKPVTETVWQTFRFPLAWFTVANPQFSLESVTEVAFLFDRTPSGKIYLDDLGFSKADDR